MLGHKMQMCRCGSIEAVVYTYATLSLTPLKAQIKRGKLPFPLLEQARTALIFY
jgi:hypothetical protein